MADLRFEQGILRQPTVYLLENQAAAASCLRALIEAGIDPVEIDVHCWDAHIAVRVRVAVPEAVATLLAGPNLTDDGTIPAHRAEGVRS